MRVIAVLIALALCSADAYACRVAEGRERAEQIADRREQRALVRKLAADSDMIVMAVAERVVEQPDNFAVSLRVLEVMKGNIAQGAVTSHSTPNVYTIGCTISVMFRNISFSAGETYLVYARDAELLRAGEIEREWPEISLREEKKLVRRALSK